MPSSLKKPPKQLLAEYFEFLRFPTITAEPGHEQAVRACADWLEAFLQQCGLQTEQWPTKRAPIVFAHDQRAGPQRRTLLIYCHYDVQPVDPLEAWITPPFEPTLRDGHIYARGAADDKGQCFYTLCALRAFLQDYGRLPINLKIVIEGEEESGSEGLHKVLQHKHEVLQADDLLIVDSGIPAPAQPAIALGARGIMTSTITLREGICDLHSGQCGGLALNPNRILAHLLASLHDAQGRVAIPGFYDHVVPIVSDEWHTLDTAFDDQAFESCYGFKPHGMAQGVDPVQANWLQPTCEINGIAGGYAGPGFKTVIPAQATAKISCRLVPKQDPHQIAQAFTRYLQQHVPKHIALDVTIHPGAGPGFRQSVHSPLACLLRACYSDVFKRPCTNILMGGSIPVVPDLMAASGAEALLIGTVLPTNRIHAPNEHFAWHSFEEGYQIIYRLFEKQMV